jgi:GNAT superfamily N-acetyltransferase
MTEASTIRRATQGDVASVMTVAAAAWRDTYEGLLRPETIEGFIERAYSPQRVQTRIANDHFYVATGPSGIVAFADALERADRLELLAIYALPEFRRQGAGTALLRKLLDLFPVLDISADVLEGNRKGEVFYERRGFSPRETIQLTILDEPVVERRWWRAADSMRSPQ